VSPPRDGTPDRDRNQDRDRDPDPNPDPDPGPGGITRLDDATVDRIAAGEVVERPASVVKELVENGLDADASRIAVSVRAGGTEGIRVRDDGVGIPPDELDAAVAAHATSKIDDADDLASVGTLGFRGEALHTIGAVSRLTVRSKPRGAARGAELTVEGGDVGDVRPAGCPEGTVVEVADLFYNTPARREFLGSVGTEFDHVARVVTGYALANPSVAVSLEHDGRETFATPGDGDLRSAVLAVYGREVAEAMIDVGGGTPVGAGASGGSDADGDTDGPDGPIRAVSGLVSHPETTRSSAGYLATYVNGRYVRSAALREAVLAAYGGQLAAERYPFAVLFVAVDPDAVDANVHPRKTEVRFDAEPAVRRAVRGAVRDALLDHGILRSTAPRGRSAPDETAVDAEPPAGEAVGGAGADAGPPEPPEPPDSGSQEGKDRDGSGSGDADGNRPPGPESASPVDPADPDAWRVEGLGGDTEGDSGPGAGSEAGAGSAPDTGPDSAPDADRPSPRNWQVADPDPNPDAEAGLDPTPDPDPDVDAVSGRGDGDGTGDAGTPIRGPIRQRTLTGSEAGVARGYDSLPRLRVLGQLHDTYILAESPDGLVVIDQHAADERVNYERLRAAVDGTAQALAEPVEVELTAREAAAFADAADAAERLGFRAERVADRTVRVDAVPAVFDAALDPELLREALGHAVRDGAAGSAGDAGADDAGAGDADGGGGAAGAGAGGAVADAADELLADLACYPAITGGTGLREGSVVELLDALDDCENPYACPHGRPTLLAFDREELAERFERDYPGHAGRRAE